MRRHPVVPYLVTQITEDMIVEPRLLLGQLRKGDGIVEIKYEIRHAVGDDICVGCHSCSRFSCQITLHFERGRVNTIAGCWDEVGAN